MIVVKPIIESTYVELFIIVDDISWYLLNLAVKCCNPIWETEINSLLTIPLPSHLDLEKQCYAECQTVQD